MFTGIVTHLGKVEDVEETHSGKRLRIAEPGVAGDLAVGDSVAVNGVCLTVVDISGGGFVVEAVAETLARTTLGLLEEGSAVDLERPAAVSGRLDGHIVQGHIDGVGEVMALESEGESIRMQVSLPEELARYVVEKGSIAADGVSLTVTAVGPADVESWFEVALIPHTLTHTVLGHREVGDRLNLEVDVVAKYVERMLERGR